MRNTYFIPSWVAVLAALTTMGSAQTIEVEATLRTMSKIPSIKDLGTYNESLIACHWAVDRVVAGALPLKEIIVYHWSVLDRQLLPPTTWHVGEKHKLKLRPYADVPRLARFRKDEDVVLDRMQLPVYYDTAQGADLPANLTGPAAESKVVAESLRKLAPVEATVKIIGIGDCRVADGFAADPFYGGTGKAKQLALNFGDAGSDLAGQDYRFRLAVNRCKNLEWGFWGGGPSRARGGFPETLIEPGTPWPPLPGRGPAPAAGQIDVRILPGGSSNPGQYAVVTRCGVVENWIREFNRRGLKFMTGLILTANAGSTARIDGMGPEQVPVLYERWLALSKIYPNYCFIERTDIGQSWGLQIKKITPTAILEEWRVKHDAKNQSPRNYPWTKDPADLEPAAATVAQAVNAAKSGAADLVVGGAWGASAMAGKGTMATIPNSTTAEAELVVRSAVAAGKPPRRVIWCVEPLMLTAPRTEKPIGALAGPAWPALDPKATGPSTVGPIRLGYGTTVARGKGVWEFGLEHYLILEAAIAECSARGIAVVLALGPNDAGIPDMAYRGMADRLRALTVQYKGVQFVEPGDAVAGYLADTKKGVLASKVKPPA